MEEGIQEFRNSGIQELRKEKREGRKEKREGGKEKSGGRKEGS